MVTTPSMTSPEYSSLDSYIVIITANGDNPAFAGVGGHIKAWMPESLQLSLSAQYETTLGGGISDAAVGSVGQVAGGLARGANGGTIGGMTGQPVGIQQMSLQTWKSSDPIRLTLSLVFMAIEDPMEEVMKPAVALMSTILPKGTNVGGAIILEAPGPTYNDSKRGTYQIQYGDIMNIPNAIINSVNLVADSLIYDSGKLIGCTVDVSVETSMITTIQDFLQV